MRQGQDSVPALPAQREHRVRPYPTRRKQGRGPVSSQHNALLLVKEHQPVQIDPISQTSSDLSLTAPPCANRSTPRLSAREG